MVNKLIAAVVLLGANLFAIPAFAAPSPSPSQQAATTAGDLRLAAATSSDVGALNLSHAKGVLLDAGKIVVSPLHWDSTNWLKTGEKIKDFVSKTAVKFHENDKQKLLVAHLSIIPQVGKDMTGMSVKYNF